MAAETGPAHASNERSPTSLTNAPRGPQPESEQDGASARGPEALGSLVSRADSAGRTRLLLRLQRQQGNQQVQRLLRKNSLVQRAPPTTASDPIQTALKSKRQEDVMAIQDVGKATDDQCIQLIQILANQSEMDGKGRRLSELWGHFAADKLPTIANAHMAEWQASVTVFPALPKMLPAVSAVEGAFSAAVRGVAEANLTQNDDYVRQQLELMGFAQGNTKPLSDEEQKKYRHNVQQIAYEVWTMRDSQRQAESTQIGRAAVGRMSVPIVFSPKGLDDHPGAGSGDPILWQKLKDQWDEAQKGIADAAARYPEIYELVAARDDAALLNYSRLAPEDPKDPSSNSQHAGAGQGYQGKTKQTLLSLQNRIHEAQQQLGSLNFLDLKPVHARLLGVPGRWSQPFDEWVAKHAVEQHVEDGKTRQLLFDLGVGAAAILATFATGGLALALAAVGTGLSVTQAAIDAVEASKLDTVAKATPLKSTELISQSDADAKTATARAELIGAAIAVLTLGLAAGAAVADARLAAALERLAPDVALRQTLLAKVGNDKRVLVRLLGKAESPAQLNEAFLVSADVAKVEALLGLRLGLAKRVSLIRGNSLYAERLTANAELEATLAKIENNAKNPATWEAAAKDLEQLEGTLDKQARSGLWQVDPAMIAADEKARVIIDGKYIKNPTARPLLSLLDQNGKIGGKNFGGQYMYVVDTDGQIIIGTRGGQRMPHPTLIGGDNPSVRAAGIVDIRAGRIYSVNLDSGHFKPGVSSLPASEGAFNQLPPKAFASDFQGYAGHQ